MSPGLKLGGESLGCQMLIVHVTAMLVGANSGVGNVYDATSRPGSVGKVTSAGQTRGHRRSPVDSAGDIQRRHHRDCLLAGVGLAVAVHDCVQNRPIPDGLGWVPTVGDELEQEWPPSITYVPRKVGGVEVAAQSSAAIPRSNWRWVEVVRPPLVQRNIHRAMHDFGGVGRRLHNGDRGPALLYAIFSPNHASVVECHHLSHVRV